jgi:predicted metal-dependent HD superfamily phosphohydrolase
VKAPDDRLRDGWRQIVGDGYPQIIEAIIDRLAEPHRHYHTSAHVAAVLDRVDDLLGSPLEPNAGEPLDGDAVRVGALFHDVVYDPLSSTNEADSAETAVQAMTAAGWPARRCALLGRIIAATANHQVDGPEAAVLLDADLAILGSTRQTYDRYVAAVRQEYAMVGDADWAAGRSAVLTGLLARPYIYATPTMRRTVERRARDNLRRELLSHQGDDIAEVGE